MTSEEIKTHKDLVVWQKSFALVKAIYQLTENFPAKENYGLTSQMRRAAVSIPSNIAEGRSRGSKKEYAQFITIAYGSAAELDTQLLLSVSLGYASELVVNTLLDELEQISRMLNKMKYGLKASP